MNDPISRIKNHFNGQWDYAIQSLTGFDGKPTHCPQHGGKSGRAFYGKRGKYSEVGMTFCNTCGCQADGISTIAFITNRTISEVVKDLLSLMGGSSVETTRKAINHQKNDRFSFKKAMNNLYALVNKTVPLSGNVQYFENRGIKRLANCYYRDIRLAEGVEHYENSKKLTNHAVVCLVRNAEGKIRTMQRIFLDDNLAYKAKCEHPKKIMPAPKEHWMTGSAVWLKPKYKKTPNDLHVCEGVETGLSIVAQSNSFIELACALTANNMSAFEIPENIKRLIIWADHDDLVLVGDEEIRVGQDRAVQLKRRAESLGIETIIHTPTQLGDWNDWQEECASIFAANDYR